MKKTLEKIAKIANITTYIVWTLFICISYGVAWVCSPSYESLRMNEVMCYTNWVVNSVFLATLAADVFYGKIKKEKASD